MNEEYDEKIKQWENVMRERGHTPIMHTLYEGLDIFVLNEGYHNGPGCSECGWSCCMHCQKDPYEAVPKTCER